MCARWSLGGGARQMDPPPAAAICQVVGPRYEKSSSVINVDLMVSGTGVAESPECVSNLLLVLSYANSIPGRN